MRNFCMLIGALLIVAVFFNRDKQRAEPTSVIENQVTNHDSQNGSNVASNKVLQQKDSKFSHENDRNQGKESAVVSTNSQTYPEEVELVLSSDQKQIAPVEKPIYNKSNKNQLAKQFKEMQAKEDKFLREKIGLKEDEIKWLKDYNKVHGQKVMESVKAGATRSQLQTLMEERGRVLIQAFGSDNYQLYMKFKMTNIEAFEAATRKPASP